MSADIEKGALERLSPSRFLSFAFPNPNPRLPNPYGDPLRVAVLDSPRPDSTQPKVAAILVPRGREEDWIFSTDAGHLQLLLCSSSPDLSISRLILIGDLPVDGSPPKTYTRPKSDPDPQPLRRFQQSLLPLLLALSPKAAFWRGVPEIPFLSYEDDLARIVLVDRLVGPVVGEMLVEDVEIDGSPSPELRRRLRFKRMPNLVQTQVRILPNFSKVGIFQPETGSLVQPYLGPMVAGLSLIAQLGSNSKPRALCVGVGGGALLMSLKLEFGFSVLGVEADEVVLRVARRRFGLIEDEFLKVCVGDGIKFIEHWAQKVRFCGGLEIEQLLNCNPFGINDIRNGFNAIMVDLDSGDAMSGVSAPPLEFIQRRVLLAARLALCEQGILVVNVIPPDRCFYKLLVDAFREVFAELFEIDVGNGENYVIIATASPVGSVASESGPFSEKLKQVLGKRHVDCIKKI